MRSFYHGDRNFHSLIYLRLQYRTTHCFESFIVPTMERFCTGEASNHIVNNVVREHRSKARDDSRSGLHDANDKIVSGNLVQRVLVIPKSQTDFISNDIRDTAPAPSVVVPG
jgi:hypothetical protein